jgi:hypothetical protein
MVFAAVTLGGWTMLRPGLRARRAWALVATLVIAYGVFFTATRVNFHTFDVELDFRADSHASLERLLHDPRVQAARRCGPVSVPNHKLIPDSRWILNAGVGDVVARSDPDQKGRLARGVAIYAVSRQALMRQGFNQDDQSVADTANNLPLPGYEFVVATGHYGAYARC